jgi:hypothetical protein
MTVEINLGGKAYAVSPLNIGQLGRIVPVLKSVAEGVISDFEATLTIIHTAMLRDHSISRNDFESMEATPTELRKAADKILDLAGLVAKGEPKPGEAKAGHPLS